MQYRYTKQIPMTISLPLLPLICIMSGTFLLFWVVWPIISFGFFYSPVSGYIVTPLADDFVKTAEAKEPSNDTLDYTKASNWFPRLHPGVNKSPISSYTLSIPKLKIINALVRVGTDDLNHSLIHYGDTELPGKPGNSVIFGHSVLPAFFDPKNYLTIFSLLPSLKEGDDIYIAIDGVNYRYQVVGYRITSPDDLTGLEQRYDDSYISLVTCFPAGTYLKRYWLIAKQHVPENLQE